MSRIVIPHDATDFTRELYVFDHMPQVGRGTRLVRYAREIRLTTRHKWNGPSWNAVDERKPHGSQLDRPQVIPVEVVKELQKQLIDEILSMPLYIGWFHHDHVVRDDMRHIVTVNVKGDKK